MSEFYNIPCTVKELFDNGEAQYSITDPDQSGDNIFAMELFVDCVDIPDEMIEEDEGTQVILFNGEKRLVIDSGGLGDFHLHGYNVSVIESEADCE